MTRAPGRENENHECGRAWEVEAARDGRLSGEARESLVRHVEQCAECCDQSDYVQGLANALRDLDTPAVDDVAVRRLRQQVLGRVDAELSGRSAPPWRRTRVPVVVAALTVAAAMLLAFGALRRAPVPPLTAPPQTTVEAVAGGDARWTRWTEGELERVELNDGELRLAVRRTPGGKRLIVRVPDGEIEDIGTVFRVVVSHGRTEHVGVEEGRVTLRLTGASRITISAGQTWDRPAEAAALPAAQPPSVPLKQASASAQPIMPRPAHASVAPRPVVSAVTPAPPPDAAREDGAYVNALHLLREGRESEAKAAARDYLRRFPDGFRREEMGRIAQ